MALLDGKRQWNRKCVGCDIRNWEGNRWILDQITLCDTCYENRHSLKSDNLRHNISFQGALKFNYPWRKTEPKYPDKHDAFKAAAGGAYNYVKQLVENGEIHPHSQNKSDDHLETLLASAVRSDNLLLVKYLIEKGGQTDFPFARHVAFSATSLDMLKFLYEYEGDSTKKWKSTAWQYRDMNVFESWKKFKTREEVDWFLDHGFELSREDNISESSGTSLFAAADVEVAKAFVNRGASLLETNTFGETVLFRPAANGNMPLVEYFISQGVDPLARRTSGWSSKVGDVLWKAVTTYGNLPMVKFLVSKGCDPTGKICRDRFILEDAMESGDISIIKYLVEQGAQLPPMSRMLSELSGAGDFAIEILKFFESCGVDIKQCCSSEKSFLHHVCMNSRPMTTELLNFLYDKGFDVNAQDDWGVTPLLSVDPPNQEAPMKIRWLLSKGAVPDSTILPLLSTMKARDCVPLLKNEFKDIMIPSSSDQQSPLKTWSTKHKPEMEVFHALLEHLPGFDMSKDGSNLLRNSVEDSAGIKEPTLYFLQQGVEINLPETESILTLTTYLPLIKLLIKHGADLPQDSFSQTRLLENQVVTWTGDVWWHNLKYFIDEIGLDIEQTNEVGDKLIHTAARSGNFALVKYLVEEKGCDPTTIDERNRNLLFHAMCKPSAPLLRYLVLEKGLDVNLISREGDVPIFCINNPVTMSTLKLFNKLGVNLTQSSKRNFLNIFLRRATNCLPTLKYLVEVRGLDPNTETADDAVLHQAILCQNEEVALYLLEKSDHKHEQDCFEAAISQLSFRVLDYMMRRDPTVIQRLDTPPLLRAAIETARWSMVEFIVEKVIGTLSTEKFEDDALSMVLPWNENKVDLLKYLLSKGADPTKINPEGKTALFEAVLMGLDETKLIVEAGCPLDHTDDEGETPLFPATIHRSKIRLLRYLLDKGIDPSIKNSGGSSAVWGAFGFFQRRDDQSLILLLEEFAKHGLDLTKDLNRDGENLLFPATKFNKINVVKYLVDSKVDPHKINNNNESLLAKCTKEEQLPLLQYLVEIGLEVNYRAKNGDSILEMVIKAKNEKAVEYLLNHGAKIDDESKVLLSAITSGAGSMVKLLLNRIEFATSIQRYCLSQAACHTQDKILKLLLDEGADVNLPKNIIGDIFQNTDWSTATVESLKLVLPLVKPDLIKKKFLVDYSYYRYPLDFYFSSTPEIEFEVVKLLLDFGASPDVTLDDSKQTVILRAVDAERSEIVDLLISRGANRLRRDENKFTPYMIALGKDAPNLRLLERLRSGCHLNDSSDENAADDNNDEHEEESDANNPVLGANDEHENGDTDETFDPMGHGVVLDE